MTQTILITGAGGYIGTTLVPALLEAGHHVTAVDTFWFGRELLPEHPRLHCVQCDVRDLDINQMRGVDCVIDLAALSNDPCGETYADATWQINHQARVRTAHLAKQAGVQRYLLASSCSVYGFHADLLSETSTTQPLTTYAKANLAAEKDTLALADSSFCVSALRLATLFGVSPRMRLDLVVNSMCYSAWRHGEITVNGGGTQARPLLHVKDAADAFMKVLMQEADKVCGEVINIGSPSMNCSIDEVAVGLKRKFAEQQNRHIGIRHCGPQDMRSYRVDFSKLAGITGWLPERCWYDEQPNIVTFLEGTRTEYLLHC